MGSTTLPPELWRHVLTFVTHADDEAACNAVSREWRALTREVAKKRRIAWVELVGRLNRRPGWVRVRNSIIIAGSLGIAGACIHMKVNFANNCIRIGPGSLFDILPL